MAVGMAGFAFRGGAEHGGDVIVAFDVGLLGEVQVAAVRLALAGERFLQIPESLASLQRRHGSLPSDLGFEYWAGAPEPPPRPTASPWHINQRRPSVHILERQKVGVGTSVSVRVDSGGGRI